MIDLSKKGWQYGLLLSLGFIWGSSFFMMEKGLEFYSNIEVAAIRIASAGLFFLPLIVYKFLQIPSNKLHWLFLTGLFGNALPAILFATAQTHIQSSLAGILNSTQPIFALIFAFLVFSTRFKLLAVLGVFLGLLGTCYLVLTENGIWMDGNYWYALMPIGGAMCYGISVNIIKEKLSDVKPALVAAVGLSMLAVPYLLFLIWNGTFSYAFDTAEAVKSFIYILVLGFLGTSVGVFGLIALLKHTNVLFASSVTYLIPIFAIGWGFVLGDVITIQYFLGMILIFGGVYLTGRKQAQV